MKKIKKNKVIGSILQVTKNVVDQSQNYYDYIIKQNNSLYTKQLPLLLKHSRMKSLVLSKPKIRENELIYQSTKNSSPKEIQSEMNSDNEEYNSPLDSIRAKKTRPNNLPSLCTIFNSRGSLIRSISSPRKNFYRNIIYNNMNLIYNLPSTLDIKRNFFYIFPCFG